MKHTGADGVSVRTVKSTDITIAANLLSSLEIIVFRIYPYSLLFFEMRNNYASLISSCEKTLSI